MTATRVHHINCGTMRPLGHQIPGLLTDRMVAHVLVVETADRLILVDSGFGLADVRERGARLGRPFVGIVGADLIEPECAIRQLPGLGYHPDDVTDIVLTHLDLDHAGGIADFPHARIHVSAAELQAATHPTLREKQRYVSAQWAHGPQWQPHDLDASTERWHGFTALAPLDDDAGEDVVMIALAGHTRGHTGVGIRTPDGWLLHAGDAYFSAGDTARPRSCPPGLKAFQVMMAADNTRRRDNLARLTDLRAGGGATVFSAHDQAEFDALA